MLSFHKASITWSRKYEKKKPSIAFPDPQTTGQVEFAEWYVKCEFREQSDNYSLPDEIQTT